MDFAPPFTVPPDPDALLRALGSELGGGDVLSIAAADRGHDRDDHAAALFGIALGRPMPSPLPWEPREVLELTRWDRPADDASGEAGHRHRAFACCVLLRAYGDPANWRDLFGENQTLIGLVDSLRVLATLPRRGPPPAYGREAAALLAWLIPRLPEGEAGERAFFGLGLLWFALAEDVPDAALLALLDWIMEAEDAAAAPWRAELGAPLLGRWLLPTTSYNQRHAEWGAFGARLPGRLRPRHGAAVVDGVRLVAAMLAPDGPPPEGRVRPR